MAEVFKNYIGGKWVGAKSRRKYVNRNPANTRLINGYFPDSDKADIHAAVTAAKKAYPSWKNVPVPKKADIIFRARDILIQQKEKMAREMTREAGKVLKETLGDVQEAIDMATFIAGEGRRLYGETTPSELSDKWCMTARIPIGVCGLITPWNFPMAVPSWKVLPAILCGNTIVFKPAEDTPKSAIRLVQALEKAGLPGGVANLVCGYGETAGAALVNHPDVRLISFTGSCEVGREIASLCGKNLKKVSLEMGGKNAQIVMDDADMELAVEGALWGAFGTTGQRCTATSRLIVHQKVVKTFTQKLVARAKKIRIGDGLNPRVEMGPIINEKQLQTVLNYIETGKKEGAKLLCGGNVYAKGKTQNGYFVEPTVFTNVKPSMRIAQEEIFGPVTCILTVRSLNEAIKVLNGTSYGLSSSIYTRDVNKAFVAIREMEAGISYVNGPTIGAEVHLPFGGIKNTGNGHREGGKTVLDIFTEWKTIFVDYSGKLQKAQIDVD